MDWLRQLYNVLVYGNFWVAAGAAALYWSSALLMHRQPNFKILAALFLATVSVYTFQRVFRAPQIYTHQPSERHLWVLRNRYPLWALCLISGAISGFLFFPFLPQWGWIVPLSLVGVAVLYVTPVIPRQGKWLRLRDVPGLKIWLIALVWTLLTVCTVDDFSGAEPLQAGFLLLSRFLFLFAITLPFDIRDLEHDRSNGVITLAGMLGVERTLVLSRSLLVAFALSAVAAYWFTLIGPGQAGALIFSAASTGWLIAKIDEEAPEWVFAFWLEGTMLDQWFWLYVFGLYWP